jgi:FMN reductase
MKIVGISGSLRNESYTHKALVQALNIVKKAGEETELIDLRTLELPFCSGTDKHKQHLDVMKLRMAVKSAHGIILVTPEYHGSLSGVLKNALDLLEANDMENKVVATISVLGGAHGYGSTGTLTHICRQLHAWVVPRDMLIPFADKAFDVNGELVDKILITRMEEMINLLMSAVKKLHGI